MRRHFKLLPLLLLLSLFTGCAQKTNRLAEAYSVFSMKPKEFSQIEITNQQLQEQKIVDKTKDIRNILRTLKKAEQLPEIKPELSALTNTYAIKLYTADSTMPFLTISYAENTKEACLFIGGDAYSVKPLDLDKLWNKLKYESIPTAASDASLVLNVLETEESDLSERYGAETMLGYLESVDQEALVFMPVERSRDENAADGWVLKPAEGEPVSLALSGNCEFWILQDHWYVSCRVDLNDLKRYIDQTEYDMLWTLYLADGEVTAVAETYSP